ncbi:MAG: non-heme iron oxygenase ferredoxin subunit [Actinobacteria bacterium]|nr:non-heme iron oxygenase ferredoxin subunit [Actinomycetota bacterium]
MPEVRVCATTDVADGATRRVDVAGLRICVVHIGDDWYAIGDRCSHDDFSLADGAVWPDECEIECPKHGSMFSLATGVPATLPATQPVPVHRIRVEGDDVLVTVDGGDA